MKKLLCLTLSALLLLAAGCDGEAAAPSLTGELSSSRDMTSGFVRTTATDDYGRTFTETAGYNNNVVGIFYFLWLNQAANDNTVEKYIAEGRGEETLTSQEGFGQPTFTWWGEPMYGYYQVEDKWVVRKHVELFINAGLDFICFDTTNNSHYGAAARTVLDVLLEYSDLGYDVPKAMFMTNTDSEGRIEGIYNDFYRRDTYDSIWFTGRGEKPWILGNSAGITNSAIRDRFYFKQAQWPNVGLQSDRFPWISWNYPQEGYYDAENDFDIMSVSVSQHVGDRSGKDFSLSGLCSPKVYPSVSDEAKALLQQSAPGLSPEEVQNYYYNANWGRGYSHESRTNDYERALKNTNFEEQWQTVYDNGNVNLVFVTGWNEWIAQRQSADAVLKSPYGHFVDTFDMEFSRDIEMMTGGYLDNCYLQLVRNVRRFKGKGERAEYAVTSADPYDLANWADAPAYADLVGETEPRSHMGAGENIYKNDTGRNDIREVRVLTDNDNVYFLVTAEKDITPREEGDGRWMNLWIGLDGQEGGWNGFQVVVNRSSADGKASVDKIEGNSFRSAGECESILLGKHLFFKVPKSLLGIGSGAYGIRFKVTDNLQKDFDVTDLYTNGDCAPIGRIAYSYYAK